ncbi:hypothetical protein HD600_000207 [Microbacterium ginsengiterrae]|uniref:Uncharacterized protein n=1 Tax=Microbacterium ginsengiterrae TaxID=546115 RepID=A0A7W9C9Z2_9MICO|nr:hypothetical protein [Microbacterium ginsengiterrae]MBB5741710.1 hypothetical protein [Microbacterium ginsengiterrae]
MSNDDDRLHAIIAESMRNARTNEALQADVQYRPSEWTPEMEAALVQKLHGSEAERIDKLIAEQNEWARRS